MASNYKFSNEEMAAIKAARRETKDKRADARSCFLVMPYCNTACMNLFLRELSEQFPLDTMNAEIVICLSISLLYHTRRYLAPFSVRYCSKISQPEFLTRLEIRFSSNSSIWSELQQILSVRTDLSQIYTQIYR